MEDAVKDEALIAVGGGAAVVAATRGSKGFWAWLLGRRAQPERPIVLGRDIHLDEFAEGVGGDTHVVWARGSSNFSEFQQAFHGVMNSGKPVVFNLDGVGNPWAAAQRGASVQPGGANPRYTDWELAQISQNEQWWDRIEFYKDGQKVANPFE